MSGPEPRGVGAGIQAWALIESIGDQTLMVGLSPLAIRARGVSAECSEVLRWSQRVIDLAGGDPPKGNFIIGSPLAVAFTTRGYCSHLPGPSRMARHDQRHGLALARSADPVSYAIVVAYVYFQGIPNGVLMSDDSAVRDIADALRIAERSGDDRALALRQDDAGRCAGTPPHGSRA